MIDPRQIDIEPNFNARDYTLPENRAHLDRLRVLIRESIDSGGPGVEKPIITRLNRQTGRATVVDGECRLRAVLELIAEGHELLSMADMPCFPAPAGSENSVTRAFASLNANEGKSLSKWELGKKYQELYNQNISIPTIAKKTANSESFIKECIDLANAPDELKQLLSSQAVSPAEAIRIVRGDNVPAAVSILQAAVQAKQANGEKGPVKRAKAPARLPQGPKSAPATAAPAKSSIPQSNITKAILAMVEDVPAEDLNCEDPDAEITIKLGKLLKVLDYVVTPADLKAVGAKSK